MENVMDKKRTTLAIMIITILLLAVIGTAAAQEPVTATITTSEQAATVGDPVELTVNVTHPEGYYVLPPELETGWEQFVIADQTSATTVSNGDGSATTTLTIDARLFAPGEYATPPLVLSVTDGAGELSEVIAAPIPVSIQSVLVEGDTNLRDIKPQAELPYTNLLPWIVGGLLIALALGGGFLWWKRRQASLALALVDNRLPHEVALDELERIEGLRLPENGRFKEHYTLVSDTVRSYIEKSYGVPVTERTTGEIQTNLHKSKIDRKVSRDFVAFLLESDLIKFSTFEPNINDANQLMLSARNIVASTKPLVITSDDVDNSNGIGKQKQTTVSSPQGHPFSSNGKLTNAEVQA